MRDDYATILGPDCVCGHTEEDHFYDGVCHVKGCKCKLYRPVEQVDNKLWEVEEDDRKRIITPTRQPDID
jgi:hypothetical protein